MMGGRERRRWAVLALLCVAQFVDVLDVNAVIVALPAVGRDLGFSPEDLQWVVTAYVLTNAVLAGLSLGCSAVASTTRGTAAVEAEERGLASGLLNSSAQIGTALGLAALITVAAARTGALAGGEEASAAAVVEGFRAAFYVATGLAVAGALVPLLLMRGKEQAPLEKRGV